MRNNSVTATFAGVCLAAAGFLGGCQIHSGQSQRQQVAETALATDLLFRVKDNTTIAQLVNAQAGRDVTSAAMVAVYRRQGVNPWAVNNLAPPQLPEITCLRTGQKSIDPQALLRSVVTR